VLHVFLIDVCDYYVLVADGFFFAFGHADHRFDQHIDHCICFLYDMYVADQNAQFLRGSVLMPGVVFLILKLYQTALASLYIIIKISIAPSTIKKLAAGA